MSSTMKKSAPRSRPESNKKPWIIVTNRTEAKIFEGYPPQAKLIEQISHTQGRLRNQDLKEGKAGRAFSSWQGSHSRHVMSTELDPKEQEAHSFALRLARRLKEARSKNLTTGITVVAEPDFLGIFMKALDPSTLKIVFRKIYKDIVQLSDREIINFLKSLSDF